MNIFKGIQPLDYVLTAVMVALAVLIGLENVYATADVAHALDSHSALMIPVFGWVTRCGWALPLSMAMAYAVARFAGRKPNQVVGLVGILAFQIVTLVKDSATGGLGALVVSVRAAALF